MKGRDRADNSKDQILKLVLVVLVMHLLLEAAVSVVAGVAEPLLSLQKGHPQKQMDHQDHNWGTSPTNEQID